MLTGVSLKLYHLRMTFNILLGAREFSILSPDDNLTHQEFQKDCDI